MELDKKGINNSKCEVLVFKKPSTINTEISNILDEDKGYAWSKSYIIGALLSNNVVGIERDSARDLLEENYKTSIHILSGDTLLFIIDEGKITSKMQKKYS